MHPWLSGRPASRPPRPLPQVGEKADPCSYAEGPGYVQQYRGGKCQADFNVEFKVAEEGNGVALTYTDSHGLLKSAMIMVQCNHHMTPGDIVKVRLQWDGRWDQSCH